MKVNLNTIIDVSTVDYNKHAAMVIFFNGCNYRCPCCFNKQTWTEVNIVDVEYIKDRIMASKFILNTVVFSGGEPTEHMCALRYLCKFCKSLGMNTAIETNGSHPWRMWALKQHVDKFYVGINTYNYEKRAVKDTLNLDLPIVVRVVDTPDSKEIIKQLDTKHKIEILPYKESKI